MDRNTVMGVDFSGAKTKNTTRVTLAVLRDNILELKPHEPLPTRLPQVHQELRNRILCLPRDAVVALDFPFSVPQAFAKEIANKEGKDPIHEMPDLCDALPLGRHHVLAHRIARQPGT